MTEHDADALTRSEETHTVDRRTIDAGAVRVRKHVDTERVSTTVDRDVEEPEMERTPALEDDSGELITNADGSLSIPVFEEQLVVEKRLVVKERVVVRKRTVTEQQTVEADLRRERIEIDPDRRVADRVHVDDALATGREDPDA